MDSTLHHARHADPTPAAEGIMRTLAGTVAARPWFDRACLAALRRWFFPTSRLWAAARAAEGDIDRFYAAVPLPGRLEDRDRLRHVLARFETARAAAHAIEVEWQQVFFGSEHRSLAYRAAVEAARHELTHAYYATRRHFRFLVGPRAPRVALSVDPPSLTDAIYAEAQGAPSALWLPPAMAPAIKTSHAIASVTGQDTWLRFVSPSARLGDVVWARVHEPSGRVDPPTVIYGHGICVEFDQWRGLIDECQALVRLGFRVVRPEAPWHGRRIAPGRFGGERMIGTFPTGILDALTGAVQEWAVLAAWARSTSTGPLVLAGSSLGALTAQLAADKARDWPAVLRPDAMLLVTHTGDLAEAIIDGALATLWADPAEVARQGWTPELARRALSKLNPGDTLAMSPDRVVSVLGQRDTILPFAGGEALVARWGVPAQNVFVLDRGHFSAPMTLIRQSAPLLRLAEIVKGLGA